MEQSRRQVYRPFLPPSPQASQLHPYHVFVTSITSDACGENSRFLSEIMSFLCGEKFSQKPKQKYKYEVFLHHNSTQSDSETNLPVIQST